MGGDRHRMRVDPQRVFDRLLSQHGPQDWWPADATFEMIVGAVLTQRAT